MATTRIKAADRTKACQQVVLALKKQYGGRQPSYSHEVLDTLLFGVLLEDNTFEQAEEALTRLKESFFDYNEIRVSSITEIQQLFAGLPDADWKSLRVRETLQFVFEGRYSFDMEELKKKSLEAAEKHLKKIGSLTPFVANYVLLNVVGAHVVPVDKQMTNAALWLGLVEEGADISSASELLKSAIRKADVPLFFALMNRLANDPTYKDVFTGPNLAKSEDPLEALAQSAGILKDLFAGKLPAKQKTIKKINPKKTDTATPETAVKSAKKAKTKPTATKSKSVTPKSAPPKKSTSKTMKEADHKTTAKKKIKKKTKK